MKKSKVDNASVIQIAMALHQQGNLGLAKEIYEKIPSSDPQYAESLHLIGVILFQNQKHEEAISFILKSLDINPNNSQALNNLGNVYASINEINLGISAYGRALQLNPNFAETAFNKANLLRRLGNSSEALIYFNKATKLSPNYFEAHLNKGNLLRDLKQIKDAILAYECALSIRPKSPHAYYNLGLAMNMAGDHKKALEQFNLAIQLKSDFVEAYNEISTTYLVNLNYEDALFFINKAIGIDPKILQLRINKGLILTCLNRHLEGIEEYEKIISSMPNMAEAWVNRGKAFEDLRRHEEAAASFERALKLKPDIDYALGDLVRSQMIICDWSDREQRRLRLEKIISAGNEAGAPFPFLVLFDDPQLHKLSAQLYAKNKLSVVTPLGQIPPRKSGGKIRLGYYSGDFHNHATAYLMADLFESHDKSKFELYAFSFGPDLQDEMRQRVSKAFNRFVDVRAQNDRDVAVLSRELGIDVAIDLKGYTKGSRTMIFAHRAAPVQINYLGYPGTMGTNYMDYLIADPTLIPPQSQEFYTEKIIYLPHTYQVNDAKRVIADKIWSRADLGLPAEGFVFCCFNNNYKITPETFGIWMRLLRTVGGSVLWLLEDNATAAKNLQKQAHAAGVESDRLVFAKRMPLPEHLARHRLADLFLDTLPYNAHTTASDALWAGLPVLTHCGQSFASRVAASLLQAVGLPELVTHSAQAYESMAIELAFNPIRLVALKAKLYANLLTSPLFNTPLFTKHIESAYQTVHQRHLSGLEPEHIHLLI